MAENSKIEWTHHTFNAWQGCTKVSDGCKHCYAEAMMDKRWNKVVWGPQGKRIRTSASYWREPLRWDQQAAIHDTRARVFCASLSDVFEDRAELNLWRSDLWQLIEQTPHLDWLLLTKRPQHVLHMAPRRWTVETDAWPRNVWVGASVENQKAADERIPALSRVPAPVRFLSCEPLLDFINLMPYLGRLHWVIAGGESGPQARPMDLRWAKNLRDQCRAKGVPYFFKQLGGTRDKGGALTQIPPELRIRQFPHLST